MAKKQHRKGQEMGYLDIQNLYKEQDILLFKECYALEKIHGTCSHIMWKEEKMYFFSGGEPQERFEGLFNKTALTEKFAQLIEKGDRCIVYGEAYGGKQQGMSETYGKDLKFVAFDVKIGEHWLAVPQAEDLVKDLGLEFVSYSRIFTDLKSIDAERDKESVQAIRNGMGSGKKREGIVLRPLIELIKNNGGRIICKHKQDWAKETKTPRVVDPERIKVLDDAQAVADEYVVPMRLEHVLQEHPEANGMEHTPIVIKAMIADVYKEAKGEIVESKEVMSAIGKKTAQMWKKRIEFAFREKNAKSSETKPIANTEQKEERAT